MSLVILLLIYLGVGLAAGISSGLFGIGGGIIFVPALAAVFYYFNFSPLYIMHLSIGSSLAAMALTTLIASISHHKLGHMNKPLVLKIMPGAVLGAITGVLFADSLTTDGLRWFFSLFLIFVGVGFLIGKWPKWANHHLPSGLILFILSWGVGICSGLLGIGGGLLLVPLLLFFNVSFKEATATALASAFPTVLFGATTSMLVGYNNNSLPEYSVGYLYFPAVLAMGVTAFLGAPIGAYLNHKLPVSILKRSFAIILLLVSVKMLPITF